MHPAAACLVLIVGAAVLNRVRGGGLWGDRLPGHPRFYVAPAMGILSLLVLAPLPAAGVAVSFLAWSWLPWGRWYDLGRMSEEPTRLPTRFEMAITAFSRDNDYTAFTLRNALGLALAAFLVSPWAMALAPLQTAAYEAGWRFWPRAPIALGELLTGCAWGAFVAALGLI